MADVTNTDPPLDPEDPPQADDGTDTEDPEQPAEDPQQLDDTADAEEDFGYESDWKKVGTWLLTILVLGIVLSLIGATQRTTDNQGRYVQPLWAATMLGLRFLLPYVLMLSSVNFIVLVFRMILRLLGSEAQSGESDDNRKDGAPRDLLQWIWSKTAPTEEGVGRVYDPYTLKAVQLALYLFTFCGLASVVYQCSKRDRERNCVTEAIYDFPYAKDGRTAENLRKGVERVRYGESGAPEKKKIDTYDQLATKVKELEKKEMFAKEESPDALIKKLQEAEAKVETLRGKTRQELRKRGDFAAQEAERAQKEAKEQAQASQIFEGEYGTRGRLQRLAQGEKYDAEDRGVIGSVARMTGLNPRPNTEGPTMEQIMADAAASPPLSVFGPPDGEAPRPPVQQQSGRPGYARAIDNM